MPSLVEARYLFQVVVGQCASIILFGNSHWLVPAFLVVSFDDNIVYNEMNPITHSHILHTGSTESQNDRNEAVQQALRLLLYGVSPGIYSFQ